MIGMGSRADLKVCHVWKWLHDLISGYAAARNRLEMMTGYGTFRHWKWSWLWLSWGFVSEYLCSTVSFNYIMLSLMFRFLVWLLGRSSRVWVSILSLIFQLSARPRRSEAQTASIVSICKARWWSHQQLHASLRSSALTRLHQLRICC